MIVTANLKLKLPNQMTRQYLILFCWLVRHLKPGFSNCSLNTPLSEPCRDLKVGVSAKYLHRLEFPPRIFAALLRARFDFSGGMY
jgi:hypothetical protein